MSKIKTVEKEEYPALLKEQRRNIGVLRTRLEYLHERVNTGVSSRAASYHRDEISALEWALELIDNAYKEAA
jgi:hypothetical protein